VPSVPLGLTKVNQLLALQAEARCPEDVSPGRRQQLDVPGDLGFFRSPTHRLLGPDEFEHAREGSSSVQ
jgi:hypothetical protein